MHKSIDHLFQKMENHREDLYQRLQSYPSEVMNEKVNDDSWSVVQVIDHLILSEQSTIEYLKKKTTGGEPIPSAGPASFFRYHVLKFAMILPIKFRAPRFIGNPDNSATLDQAMSRWKTVRLQLDQLLSTMTAEQINAEVFKHPIAGKMNLKQALKFIQSHVDRHTQQIFNILKQLEA